MRLNRIYQIFKRKREREINLWHVFIIAAVVGLIVGYIRASMGVAIVTFVLGLAGLYWTHPKELGKPIAIFLVTFFIFFLIGDVVLENWIYSAKARAETRHNAEIELIEQITEKGKAEGKTDEEITNEINRKREELYQQYPLKPADPYVYRLPLPYMIMLPPISPEEWRLGFY